MAAFEAPPAPPGWVMTWRRSSSYDFCDEFGPPGNPYSVPHYKREDGWEVLVRGSSDIQIGWTWWPKVKFAGIEAKVPGSFWGPGAVAVCLSWVDEKFPLPRQQNGFQGQPWKVEFFMFLHRVDLTASRRMREKPSGCS